VSFGHGEVFSQRESSWDFRHRNDLDGELGTIKLKIPYFQGKIDPEAYIEWENKVDWIFDCHHYI
jgi:hypothetical protein